MIVELPRDILIHGVFSTRKTSQAMTVSKDYPPLPALAPLKGVTKLTDIGVIAWDSQATMTLPHLGIELAPERVFRTTGRMQPSIADPASLEPESVVNIINATRKWGIEQAKTGVKYFIHDSVSTKDTRIVTFWTRQIDDDPKQGKDAGQKLYRNVLKTHSMDLEFWQNLAVHYDAYNIWIAHTSIKGQDAPSMDPRALAATELQRKAKGLIKAELGARITGQSWNFFYENVRAVYYQELEQDFGKQVAKWTTRSNEAAVKPGFPSHIVPDKMNADFRELFARIRGEWK